jgi:hypothetical protein
MWLERQHARSSGPAVDARAAEPILPHTQPHLSVCAVVDGWGVAVEQVRRPDTTVVCILRVGMYLLVWTPSVGDSVGIPMIRQTDPQNLHIGLARFGQHRSVCYHAVLKHSE